jgi:energy-coupling factor transport system ATP-binding protein
LILDEPTAGLDPEGTKMMMDLFKKLNQQGMTIVLVTHDMDLMYAYANQVCVLQDGKIALTSDMPSLFNHPMMLEKFEKPSILQWIECLNAVNMTTKKHLTTLDEWAEDFLSSKKEKR